MSFFQDEAFHVMYTEVRDHVLSGAALTWSLYRVSHPNPQG
jgi:hypothetical protein